MPKQLSQVLSGVVILIGAYMVYSSFGAGWTAPPVLSGIALIILGVKTCLK